MPNIRLKNMSIVEGTSDALLNDWFGYRTIVVDGELQIPETDKALRKGPKDIVKLHPRIDLRSTHMSKAAAKMIRAIPRDFDEYYREHPFKLPKGFRISGNFGVISKVEEVITQIAASPKDQLPQIVESSLIPLMVEEFKATHVTPITIDAELQQKYNSLSKAAFLTEQYGPKVAGELSQDHDVLRGIEITGGLGVLSFVEPMTRFNPVLFSFPIQREGCVWHFTSAAGHVLDIQATRSLFDKFSPGLNPRYEKVSMIGRLPSLKEDDIWRLLRLVTRGINNLMRYFNDPRSFLDDDGNVDWLNQIKGRGLVYLLFSDLISLTNSHSPHERISAAFSILDKLGHMRNQIGGISAKEADASVACLSLLQGKDLKKTFKSSYLDIAPAVGRMLSEETNRSYKALHLNLAKQSRTSSKLEAIRLRRMRAFRNLNHGTYLSRGQFDLLFLESSGSVPEEIATIPWLLVHGLMANPSRFIQFDPMAP